MFRPNKLPEAKVFEILANQRRRETIRHLSDSADGKPVTLRELSIAIATAESGESPPPKEARESVYNSLHQTHIPKLEKLGVVTYDRNRREVRLRETAREVNIYMELLTRYGLTWSEIYRTLGVLSLTTVVAALADIPAIRAIDPLLWASAFLLVFVIATAYQLWTNRWVVRRALQD